MGEMWESRVAGENARRRRAARWSWVDLASWLIAGAILAALVAKEVWP